MERDEIMLIHGTNYKEMTVSLLEKADMAADIKDKNTRIGIKPNLVLASAPENGAVTHPEIVAGVIEYLKDKGFENICVLEGAWVGARTMDALRASGIGQVCRHYGVEFIDLQKDKSHSVDAAGLKLNICDKASEVEFLINLPVLKGHCQTALTCALKNLKGLLPNSEKRRFHSMGLHRPIAHLSAAFHQDFIIVDNICGDVDFEEGGNPVTMNRIFCCKDPVLCDSFGCRTLGLSIDDVPYIRMAEALGIGSSELEKAKLIQLNPCTVEKAPGSSRKLKQLEKYTAPKDACSACYGMLIHALDKMDRCGELWGHQQKICIGQGYRGAEGEIGVGSCTAGCSRNLPGCPPSAEDILSFLRENWI